MPRPALDGVRTHVILTKYQSRELKAMSEQTGMTVAEHIRRALDIYLANLAGRLNTTGKQ